MHAAALILATLSLDGASSTPRIFKLDAGDLVPISAETVDANGEPVRSYNKAILRVGAKVRNVKGEQVVITSELIDGVKATFDKMRSAGITVPIQLGHTTDGEKTRGKAQSLWRHGDTLWMACELKGRSGIALASTNDVSVYIEPTHERDGVTYPNALTHVALTPLPQVTGLGEFVPLAASLQDAVFSTASEKDTATMDWKLLAVALGLNVATLNDTTGPAAVTAAVNAAVAEKNSIAASLKSATEKATALELSVTTLTNKVAAGAPQIPAEILDEHASIAEAKADGLVARRIITPAQKDKLLKLAGEKGKRSALCLSKTAAEHAGLAEPLLLGVLSILGEATGNGSANGQSQTGNQGAPPAEGAMTAEDKKAWRERLKQYA